MKQIGQGAGHLGARRPTADDHDVQRSLLDQPGLAISVFKQGQEPRAQALGVDQGIEWKAICVSPRDIQKVRLSTCSQHQLQPRSTHNGEHTE